MDLWKGTYRCLKGEYPKKAVIIMWSLWNARNKCFHNNQTPDFKNIRRSIQNCIDEEDESSKEYLKSTEGSSSAAMENQLSHPYWIAPAANRWKINVDASWDERSGKGGMEWLIRDSIGSLIGGGCKRIAWRWSIKILEAKAISEGLKTYIQAMVVEDFGIRPELEVESDSLEVIQAINKESSDLSELLLVVEEIEEMIPPARVISFVKCSRSSNEFAHKLVRAGVIHGEFIYFFGHFSNSFFREVQGARDESIPNWFKDCLVGVPTRFY